MSWEAGHAVEAKSVRKPGYRSSAACKLCRLAANDLGQCLNATGGFTHAIPRQLSKDCIIATLKSKAVKGRIIGNARLALRLTVKNVWDFDEMVRRGQLPTEKELQTVDTQIHLIRAIVFQMERITEATDT